MLLSTKTQSKSSLLGFADKLAISGSVLCALHCLVTPLLIVLLPSVGSSFLADESFHLWLVVLIIPTSLIALGLGCRKHGHLRFLFIGIVGLSFLVSAILLESIFHSDVLEKGLTLIGSFIIAVAHIDNFRRCRDKTMDCN